MKSELNEPFHVFRWNVKGFEHSLDCYKASANALKGVKETLFSDESLKNLEESLDIFEDSLKILTHFRPAPGAMFKFHNGCSLLVRESLFLDQMLEEVDLRRHGLPESDDENESSEDEIEWLMELADSRGGAKGLSTEALRPAL